LSNIEEIIQFHTDFKNGLIGPVLKSEPIPTDQNETDSLVKTVVGKNFDEIVRDSSKDVFVEFYAPWCSHCKKIEPAWEELAGHYANTDDVVIARMDATANKVKDLTLSGYPSFKFYGKNDKNGVDYKGKHDMNELNNFLREKSTAAANTVLKVDLWRKMF